MFSVSNLSDWKLPVFCFQPPWVSAKDLPIYDDARGDSWVPVEIPGDARL